MSDRRWFRWVMNVGSLLFGGGCLVGAIVSMLRDDPAHVWVAYLAGFLVTAESLTNDLREEINKLRAENAEMAAELVVRRFGGPS